MWTADSPTLAPGRPVTLTTKGADGIRYSLKISVDDGYLFTVDQSVANASGKPVALRPIGLVSRSGKSADPSTWTDACRPDQRVRRRGRLRHRLGNARRGRRQGPDGRQCRRLARLHRQILADRARARRRPAHDRRFPPFAERRLPGRLCACADHPRAGQDADHPHPPVRRRQGKGVARPLRGRRASPSFRRRSTGAGSNGSCGRSSTCCWCCSS